ncbi:hypothetical protein [Inhella proteolytica]|uniref:Lipoprotein n=1 Tax=Inhella proteolytica TaxID=2795029 RepID=A0A931NHX0_9BURK|nr:hypothetical protein [Inhella proteolytica]MBH9577504.1 hypothetical protein [Inhella proteolytica]
MLRRTLVCLPAAAALLAGCSSQRLQQGEAFAAYLSFLFRGLPALKALSAWDQPPYFEAVEAGTGRTTTGKYTERLVVSSQTSVEFRREWKDADAARQVFPDMHPSAAKSLMQRSEAARSLYLPTSRLPPKLIVDLVSPQLIQDALGPGADLNERWNRFYERYPESRGIAHFSAAGISVDGQQAVFTYELGCGPTCGCGYAVLMRRVKGAWWVEDHRMMWIS